MMDDSFTRFGGILSLRKTLPLFFAALFTLAGVEARAQNDLGTEFTSAIEFGATEMQALEKAAADKLAGLGAVVVDMSFFPATFISTVSLADGSRARCTATAVGPEAILLAAHCMADGGSIRVAGRTASCNHSPMYDKSTRYGKTADYALCKLNSKLPAATIFESLKTDLNGIAVGGLVLLSGFGCTTKNPPTYDRTFRVGFATVKAKPTTNSNDIVTDWDSSFADTGQGAAICSGDSGGAVYFVPNIADLTKRFMIAVNSRSEMTCIYGPSPTGGCINDFATIEGRSYLSSLSTSDAAIFLEQWTNEKNVSICGINLSGDQCR